MNWQTFGHNSTKRLLELQLGSGNLAHAYLFFGPDGVGKKMLAMELAGKILSADILFSHPDFSILDQEEEISIERMRQFTESLAYKPFVGAKKVAIINNAHLMNTQSSNALLKTLEEPSQSTIIILVSANKDLLPTIVSRCQAFSINGFTASQLREFSQAYNFELIGNSLQLSFGSIARLLQLQNKEKLSLAEQSINEFETLKASPVSGRLLAIGKIAEQESFELKKMLTTWLMWQKDKAGQDPSSFKIMNYLLNALDELGTNKNKKLILQSLLINL